MIRIGFAVLIATLLLLPTASAREVSFAYTGPTPFLVGCTGGAGGCADIHAGDTKISVRVDDATGAVLSFRWIFSLVDDAHGGATVLGSGSACGSVADVPVPAGANQVVVSLSDATLDPAQLHPACETGVPTTGSIALDIA